MKKELNIKALLMQQNKVKFAALKNGEIRALHYIGKKIYVVEIDVDDYWHQPRAHQITEDNIKVIFNGPVGVISHGALYTLKKGRRGDRIYAVNLSEIITDKYVTYAKRPGISNIYVQIKGVKNSRAVLRGEVSL